ncbi:Sugar/inositol transporter [Penicillium camemberti]|uniref:Sugar/inositol transporter n=1 Tax=Penicillium camemberti (strain FM 013) TaxID=1429867 RepID=A0A0G4P9F3_PENC3|nr:Sugar/inositol transporter [Penicillium camemberti]
MSLRAAGDVNSLEAPITWKAYALCAFASLGGIYFGYDSGYINGVNGIAMWVDIIEPGRTTLTASHSSLIVSILSAGTFFGAVLAGDVAEWIGRKWTVICGCAICLLALSFKCSLALECPKSVRGAIVACYQFCVTIGLMLASCLVYGTEKRKDTGSFRIPIAIQFIWAIVLAAGLIFLPDSPRYFVKKGRIEEARKALCIVRDQPPHSEYIEAELSEIIANEEYERSVIPDAGWFGSWKNCFTGSLWVQKSNLRRTILGTSLQMMQQWTGVNFIFYFSTTFLQSTGAISNTFLMSMIFTIVNVFSTPISFYTVEKFGRRPLLIFGALGMLICQFLVAIIGVTIGFNKTHVSDSGSTIANNISAVNAQVALIAIYIFFFASTWGPGAWILVGEIFPIPIRSRGVALSTASNWLWNTIIAVITPYMVGENPGEANMRSSVFFVWGSLCTACFVYSYFLVPETKGLSLEQVDKMMEESTPRTSAKWRPHSTFAEERVAAKTEYQEAEHIA